MLDSVAAAMGHTQLTPGQTDVIKRGLCFLVQLYIIVNDLRRFAENLHSILKLDGDDRRLIYYDNP